MGQVIDWARFIQLHPSFVYDEIFVHNEYGLVEDEIKGRTVIDCGANVGIFTARCLELGAKHVIAVEAQPSIFKWGLEFNMRLYPQVTSLNLALGAVDDEVVHIENNFIASKIGKSGEAVKTVSLATLLKMTDDTNMVLKVDIEGAEYDALLTANLSRLAFIHIEMHPDPRLDLLRQKFNSEFDLVSTVSGAGCFQDKWRRR